MLKKVTLALAVTGLMAGMAFAGTAPKSGINGSAHDINAFSGATADVYGRTCVFCHTPHNAVTDDLAPLWNRATDGAHVIETYTWKAPANSTIAVKATSDALSGPSRLCMSCHDGLTAVDSHASNGSTAGTATAKIAGRASALNLGSTHPIGFKYADAVAARNLAGKSAELKLSTDNFIDGPAAFGGSASAQNTFDGGASRLGEKISNVLYNDTMTCATCHEVHNKNNVAPAAANYNYFLRAEEAGSAICISCHIK